MKYLCEKAENNLEIKKKESKIRRMQEERLRVSSENQLHPELAHCGTVASITAITTTLYGNVGEIE